MRLEKLNAGHRDAVLEFETVNRDYFASMIPDRGDEFFAGYPARHFALLQLQAEGTDIFHVILDDDATILGRINLIEIADGVANVGYRIAKRHTGRGVASWALENLCVLARSEYGLHALRAMTRPVNVASQKVLLRNGFVSDGESIVDGKMMCLFSRSLINTCLSIDSTLEPGQE